MDGAGSPAVLPKSLDFQFDMDRARPLKNIIRLTALAFKWVLIIAITLEITGFLFISVSNLVLYGGLRERSRVCYDPYALFLNEEGAKPTPGCPAPSHIQKRIKRIWMLGGSTMRGDSRENIPTIPAFLSQMVNGPDSSVHYEFWNFGENAFNSLLEVKYLQKLLIQEGQKPDLVVFFDGVNDAMYLSQYRTPNGHQGYRRLRSLIESSHRSLFGLLKPLNAALYCSFSKELYDKIMQTMIPLDENASIIQDFVRSSEQRYDYVNRTAQSTGASFVFILQPTWWVESGTANPETAKLEQAIMRKEKYFPATRENVRTVYRVLSKKLEGKPYFVDFSGRLMKRRKPVYRNDGVHLTREGRRMIAADMAALFKKRGFLEAKE